MPILPFRQPNGEWLRLEIALPGYSVWLRAWQVQVGQVKLYLLDSNDAANFPAHRGIARQLYRGRPRVASEQNSLGLAAGGCSPRSASIRKSVISMKGMRLLPSWNGLAVSCKRPGEPSRPRCRSREREICLRPIRQWLPALTVSLQPSWSNTSEVTPRRKRHRP